MGLDEFDECFTQTVTVEQPTGVSAYGEVSYGNPVTYPARIVGRIRKVTDKQGQERVSSYTIYLKTADIIDPNSRVTIPSEYVQTQLSLLAVGTYPDETGHHHTVLFLG